MSSSSQRSLSSTGDKTATTTRREARHRKANLKCPPDRSPAMSAHDLSRATPSGRRSEADRDPLLGLALEQVGIPQEPATATNFVFSPVSIRLALSLVAAGAGGETLDQMLSFLGSPTSAELKAASARLVDSVLASQGTGDPPDRPPQPSFPGKRRRERWGPRPRLSLASGVWVDNSLALKPSFQNVATSIYRAQSKAVDFKTQSRVAASEVNAWAEKETNGLIRDLLPCESMDPCTSLVLATALYFGAAWEEPFAERETELGDFYLLDGSSVVQTPFMSTKERKFIAAHDGFKVLKLPYHRGGAGDDGQRFSMCLFLPDELRGLRVLAKELVADPGFVCRHVPSRKVKVGALRIPKFRVSFHFEASEALRRLGLELPFSPSAAEFTEMVVAASASPRERLHVSRFHHRAVVEITEEGTVAAAVAAGVFYPRCGYVEEPVDFVADHPFLFVIRGEESGEILFLGCVVDPSSPAA